MDTLSPVLEALLAKAEADSEACGAPYGRVVYHPGNTAIWDNCCGSSDEGGQLWVRVVSLLPMPSGAQACGITDLQVRAALGGVRCQHTLDDDGKYPTVEEMLEDARAQGGDAFRLLSSIQTLQDLPAEGNEWARRVNWKSLKVEQGVPLGHEGGCGGFEWTFTLRLLLCPGC